MKTKIFTRVVRCGLSESQDQTQKKEKNNMTMRTQVFTRTGAIINSKGETVGEIAKEIGVDPKIVWRSIRQHVLHAARAGKEPAIQPEHWLWAHEGKLETIRVIKKPTIPSTPELRNVMVAGGNVQE